MIPLKDAQVCLDGKRKVRRIDARDEFLVEFYQPSIGRPLEVGYGIDISSRGVRFSTAAASLEEGKALEMTLFFSPRFPGNPKVKLNATVTRRDKPEETKLQRIGCSFHDLDYLAHETLQQFLFWLEARSKV